MILNNLRFSWYDKDKDKEAEVLVLDPQAALYSAVLPLLSCFNKSALILIRYFTIYIVPILTMEFDQFRTNLIYESASLYKYKYSQYNLSSSFECSKA